MNLNYKKIKKFVYNFLLVFTFYKIKALNSKILSDTPPPIGFLPHYMFDQNAASHISGIDLSYDRQTIPNINTYDMTPPVENISDNQVIEDDSSTIPTEVVLNSSRDLNYDYSNFDLIGKDYIEGIFGYSLIDYH